MKKLFIVLFLFMYTNYMGFSQTKIDTVYIKYAGATKSTTKDSASYYRVRTVSNGILKAEDYSMKDNVLKCSGNYKSFEPSVKEGAFVFYSSLIGNRIEMGRSEGAYLNDEKEGVWKYYYSSGELCYTETYTKGKKNGAVQSYYKTGEIKRVEKYEDGKRIAENCYTKSGKDTVFYEMISSPSFPGGDQAFQQYIYKHLIYPRQAAREKIYGTVYVKFYVNTDGGIEDVEVIKGVHPLLDNEAIRCVGSMPRWIPGKFEGKPARIMYMTRMLFHIE